LTSLALGAVLWACGGAGGSNQSKNSTPTELQVNPSTSWELLTAGDIAQCNPLRSFSDSYAQKTAQLIER